MLNQDNMVNQENTGFIKVLFTSLEIQRKDRKA